MEEEIQPNVDASLATANNGFIRGSSVGSKKGWWNPAIKNILGDDDQQVKGESVLIDTNNGNAENGERRIAADFFKKQEEADLNFSDNSSYVLSFDSEISSDDEEPSSHEFEWHTVKFPETALKPDARANNSKLNALAKNYTMNPIQEVNESLGSNFTQNQHNTSNGSSNPKGGRPQIQQAQSNRASNPRMSLFEQDHNSFHDFDKSRLFCNENLVPRWASNLEFINKKVIGDKKSRNYAAVFKKLIPERDLNLEVVMGLPNEKTGYNKRDDSAKWDTPDSVLLNNTVSGSGKDPENPESKKTFESMDINKKLDFN
jgi:hypothetical protein